MAFNGDADDSPPNSGVPYFQTNPHIYIIILVDIIYNVIHVTIKYINRLTLYSPVYNYILYI